MGEAESLAGRILADKYLLTGRLGEGGFGSIWRAEHQILKSPVAVKLIDLDMARKDGAVERFLREAQATAALRSPHVVQVLDYGVDGEQPFIVMELLEGENLAERLEREKKLSPLEVVRIVTHVARAVGKAHELGIVHRDLKPENIFIVNTGDEELIKVLDFGVAKFAASPELNRNTYTKTGALIGTPYYMSPEQAQGNKAVDYRSDLWALGVITFEMLTGQRPFDGDALGDLVLTICVRSISIPSAVAEVPDGFDAWFAKAVEREPDARFQSAREMALALLKLVENAIGEGSLAGLYDRSNLPPPTSPVDMSVEIPSRPITAAFAATVRDEPPALGASGRSSQFVQPYAPVLAPSVPPSALSSPVACPAPLSSPFPASAPPASRNPVADFVLDATEPEEHLTPLAVLGIAILALVAGAAAVYGVFFLVRAHDASNEPLGESESNSTRPAVVTTARAGSKAHFDVVASAKPSNNQEPAASRAQRPASVTSPTPRASTGMASSSRLSAPSPPTTIPPAAAIASSQPPVVPPASSAAPTTPQTGPLGVPTLEPTEIPPVAPPPVAPPANLTPEPQPPSPSPQPEPAPAATTEIQQPTALPPTPSEGLVPASPTGG